MELPRLPPAANPYTANFDINERLRPYFEDWFQNAKRDGESPEDFLLRVLVEQVIIYWRRKAVLAAIEAKALEVEGVEEFNTEIS